MSNLGIVDADCHILEPPDIWKNHLGSKWQDKAPKLVKDAEGGDAWLTAVGGDPDPIGLTATLHSSRCSATPTSCSTRRTRPVFTTSTPHAHRKRCG